MNIFVLDDDPAKCVAQYCDAHVVKMLLETTQILCGVHHRRNKPFDGIYKASHLCHPCVVWADATFGNYRWTVELLEALHGEFEYRRGKEHSAKHLFDHLKRRPPVELLRAYEGLQPFVFVGPDECEAPTVIGSYRALYRQKAMTFKRPMRWTKREVPGWVQWVCVLRAQVGASAKVGLGYTKNTQ